MVEIGNRYGLLVVLRKGDPYINPRGKVGESRWVCRCDCGKEKLIYRSALTTGRTKSCGCLVKKSAALRCANNGKPRKRKGAYSSWAQMKSRCNNPETPGYKNYGGRGIRVCERWNSFDLFLEDMGERPDGCSIDRIDVNGDYCKENCRWATDREQKLNTRRTRNLTAYGKTMTIKEWSEETDIPYSTITVRLMRGKTIEEALSNGKTKVSSD
ncbi:TPA: hypothetical protein ACHK65_004586 [Escherichia coli]